MQYETIKLGGTLGLAVLLLATGCRRVGAPDVAAPPKPDRHAPTNPVTVMQASKPSDTEIVLTRTFAAPRETVFAALTQTEHLARWMKSTGMELVTCTTDLRVGGTLRYVFQRAGGPKLEVRGTYQAVDPPRQFVYAESYDFSPLRVLVTTTLEEVDGKTVLRQTLRYATRQERDDDFDGVVASSREAYANLEHYLGRGGS